MSYEYTKQKVSFVKKYDFYNGLSKKVPNGPLSPLYR